MPEPIITCIVIGVVAGGGTVGTGIGIYAYHEEIRDFFVTSWNDFSNWVNRTTRPPPMTEAQRVELTRIRQARESREMQRREEYSQVTDETERIAEQLHEDSKETLSRIGTSVGSIEESVSVISEQATGLIEVRSEMEARMLRQKEAFDKLEQDLREKISRLEITIRDLTQFKQTQLSVHEKEKSEFAKKLEMHEKELTALRTEKSELAVSQKKLLEQLDSLKKVIEQQDIQLQKKDTLLLEQDRQLEERDQQIKELQEARGGTLPSSRPRFFSA